MEHRAKGLGWMIWIAAIVCGCFPVLRGTASEPPLLEDLNPFQLPPPGTLGLRILSSNLLELTLISTKEPDPAGVTNWNFIGTNGLLTSPQSSVIGVFVDDIASAHEVVGFKRRPVYAALQQRDLRIANHLYLQLKDAIPDGSSVRVQNIDGSLFSTNQILIADKDPFRPSPAIHVNQVGYAPDLPKKGFVGYYLGSAGELPVAVESGFSLVDTSSSNVVFQGSFALRQDSGYTYIPVPYQHVLEADFTSFTDPGEYWLQVPELGVSLPFRISENVMATLARTYALGIYHQRCGAANALPFTRYIHGTCHTAEAEVPTLEFAAVNSFLALATADYSNIVRHVAPPLSNVDASLYPFVRSNGVDVSGGHHDAGDYSKYTINSAQFIHAMVFAVDVFPNVKSLDQLGIPESGDGISDLLQLAKREADFLSRMQDEDGGFYFLVYPRDRQYEFDTLPDRGDPQVVFPKTTAATAAAVAALAQIASSPTFREHYPNEADLYREQALQGWEFLESAITDFGWDGSFQKITHYGLEFLHDDEMIWAATELYLATGEERFEDLLLERFDPSDPATRVWSWWRLFEGYGCATRSYAFADVSGRREDQALDPVFLGKCREELLAGAGDQLLYSQSNAYGVSFPLPSKAYRVAGWFFPVNQVFDLLVGYQLDPRPEYLDAIVFNLNYEAGCNPLNQPFLTGIGSKRQREIVHQYAQNDRRVLPPPGIPLGAIQSGFPYLELYRTELANLAWPRDDDSTNAYAPYDRWADLFHLQTEFVAAQQARGLALTAFLAANYGATNASSDLPVASVPDLPETMTMNEATTVTVSVPGTDLANAMITWEARGQEPLLGLTYILSPTNAGPHWLEAEILLADGRRLFAVTNFIAIYSTNIAPNESQSQPLTLTPELTALYHLDDSSEDAAGKQVAGELFGNARFDTANLGWMTERTGSALRFDDIGDYASIQITNITIHDSGTEAIVLECLLYAVDYPRANTNIPLFSLIRNWNASLELIQLPYFGLSLRGGTQLGLSGMVVSNALPRNRWNHLRLAIAKTGYSARVNGELIAFVPGNELVNWSDPRGVSTLTIGNFEGWVDEIALWNVKSNRAISIMAELAGGDIKLNLMGIPGVQYLLQTSSDLSQWNALATNYLVEVPTAFQLPMNDNEQFFRALPIP